jgi:hypothetical protein
MGHDENIMSVLWKVSGGETNHPAHPNKWHHESAPGMRNDRVGPIPRQFIILPQLIIHTAPRNEPGPLIQNFTYTRERRTALDPFFLNNLSAIRRTAAARWVWDLEKRSQQKKPSTQSPAGLVQSSLPRGEVINMFFTRLETGCLWLLKRRGGWGGKFPSTSF